MKDTLSYAPGDRLLCARLLFCLTTLAPLVGGWATDGHAFELRVRGQSKLYADVRGAGNTLQVSGVLRDELGQPLLQRALKLSVRSTDDRSRDESLITDMQGRFRYTKEMKSGTYDVQLDFEESDHLDGATLTSSVTLKPSVYTALLQAPSHVVGRAQPVKVRLRAMADGVGVSTSITVSINDAPVGTITLDHYGRGVLDVSKQVQPGHNILKAQVRQGDKLLSTQPSTLYFASSAKVTATLEQGYVGLERGLKVEGTIADPNGYPLGKGDVSIYFEPQSSPQQQGQPLAKPSGRVKATLDEDGSFVGFLQDKQVTEGAWRARVVYDPPVGADASLSTASYVVDRTSARWILHVLGVLTILIGVLALAQRGTWTRLRAVLTRLRRQSKLKAPVAIEREQIVEAQAVEEIPEELIEASEDSIAGFVWDPWRNQIVAGATMQVHLNDEIVATSQTRSDGRFAFDGLPAGACILHIHAPGFAVSKMPMTLPHQGQLRYFRVDLIDMALKVRKFYQSWVRRWHPKEAWGKLTPREIEAALLDVVDHVEASDAQHQRQHWGEALRELIEQERDLGDMSVQRTMELLTQLIEESYYSQRLYGDDMWRLFVDVTTKLEGHLSVNHSRRLG